MCRGPSAKDGGTPGSVGRGQQEQPSRRGPEVGQAGEERLLQPIDQRQRLAGRSTRRDPGRQLQEGERVAGRGSQQQILVGGCAAASAEQQACGRAVETGEGQLRQTGERPGRQHVGPRRDDEGDGFCFQPAGRERQRVQRRLVGPMRVVDQAQQRLHVRGVRQEGQRRQRDQEPVGDGCVRDRPNRESSAPA